MRTGADDNNHTFLDAFSSGDSVFLNSLQSSDTGGQETRPKNAYVNYIIKY